MRGKYFLLFFKYWTYFFLKSKKFLLIITSHSSFHGWDIFFNFLLFLISSCLLNLNFLCNPIIFFWRCLFRLNSRFFNRICSIIFLSDRNSISFLGNFFWNLSRRWISRYLLFFVVTVSICWIYHFWCYFIMWIFGLKDLLLILKLVVLLFFLITVLFFLDITCTLYFMNLFLCL